MSHIREFFFFFLVQTAFKSYSLPELVGNTILLGLPSSFLTYLYNPNRYVLRWNLYPCTSWVLYAWRIPGMGIPVIGLWSRRRWGYQSQRSWQAKIGSMPSWHAQVRKWYVMSCFSENSRLKHSWWSQQPWINQTQFSKGKRITREKNEWHSLMTSAGENLYSCSTNNLLRWRTDVASFNEITHVVKSLQGDVFRTLGNAGLVLIYPSTSVLLNHHCPLFSNIPQPCSMNIAGPNGGCCTESTFPKHHL